MKGALEAAFEEFRHKRERDGDEALHVAGAAAVNPAVPLDHLERVGTPRLAVNGNDIRVARQDDAAIALVAQGREQVGLAAAGVVAERTRDQPNPSR